MELGVNVTLSHEDTEQGICADGCVPIDFMITSRKYGRYRNSELRRAFSDANALFVDAFFFTWEILSDP